MITISASPAWLLGFDHYAVGRTLADNPFDEPSCEGAWQSGWLSAEATALRKSAEQLRRRVRDSNEALTAQIDSMKRSL